MRTSRYTDEAGTMASDRAVDDEQIFASLRQAEGGVPVAELCREHGMSNASFYKWRAKYGGLDASLVSQKKAMEAENRRLKQIYADPKAKLRALQLKFHIQQRGKRGKPTTEWANDMGVPCCAPSASCGPRP